MASRNFNNKQFKISFYDFDEDDRDIIQMSDSNMGKLFSAISYGIQRIAKRSTSVKIVVLIDPDTQFTAQDRIMEYLAEQRMEVIFTDEGLVVASHPEVSKKMLAIKILGGANLVASAGGEDDASGASEYAMLADQGLTQECEILPALNMK